MSTPPGDSSSPPASKRNQSRYAQLLIAAVLGYSLSGLLLLNAIDTGQAGWLIFIIWIIVFTLCYTYAYRRYLREKNRPEG